MNSGWIALHRCPETEELLDRYPDAMVLLTIVAYRARWRQPLVPDGLEFGEALIGRKDFERWGKRWTERRYRSAKEVLARSGLVKFRATSRGTVATLLCSAVFSLTLEHRDEQTASERRVNGEQLPSNRRLTKKDNKDNNGKRREIPTLAQILQQIGSVPYSLSRLCAEAYFADREADGWVNRYGNPISNWRSDLERYARHWRNNELRSGHAPSSVTRHVNTKPEKTLDLDLDHQKP